MADILDKLAGDGLLSDDPGIRMRAADVVEKITRQQPDYLQPYQQALMGQVARITQQEVRWHVAQMLPRLELDQDERQEAVRILWGYLGDRSRIVQASAL